MNWIDPWGLAAMQGPALERDNFGSGGGVGGAIGVVGLLNYFEDSIKAGVNAAVNGALWLGGKMKDGVSAASGYFSKGKKVRDKEGNVIPPASQNKQQRQGKELKPNVPDPNNPSGGGNKGGKPGIIATITMTVAKCSEIHENTKESFENPKKIAEKAQQQVAKDSTTLQNPVFKQGELKNTIIDQPIMGNQNPLTHNMQQKNKGK